MGPGGDKFFIFFFSFAGPRAGPLYFDTRAPRRPRPTLKITPRHEVLLVKHEDLAMAGGCCAAMETMSLARGCLAVMHAFWVHHDCSAVMHAFFGSSWLLSSRACNFGAWLSRRSNACNCGAWSLRASNACSFGVESSRSSKACNCCAWSSHSDNACNCGVWSSHRSNASLVSDPHAAALHAALVFDHYAAAMHAALVFDHGAAMMHVFLLPDESAAAVHEILVCSSSDATSACGTAAGTAASGGDQLRASGANWNQVPIPRYPYRQRPGVRYSLLGSCSSPTSPLQLSIFPIYTLFFQWRMEQQETLQPSIRKAPFYNCGPDRTRSLGKSTGKLQCPSFLSFFKTCLQDPYHFYGLFERDPIIVVGMLKGFLSFL